MIENRINCVAEIVQRLATSEEEYWEKAIRQSCIDNPWFTDENIRHAMLAHAQQLNPQMRQHCLANYSFVQNKQKTVSIIMAGNIPMVGLHDLLCVFISGHIAQVKLSSKDRFLIPIIIDLIKEADSTYAHQFKFVEKINKPFDAVIATGSNHSFSQFQTYFKGYPNLLRKSRTSVAILDGSERLDQLKALAKDVFMYFGLGCRSVTKIFVPINYKFDNLFEAFFDYKDIINHHKYANNYDYHKAMYLLANHSFLDNGFLLVKEDSSWHSPVSVLHYEPYESYDEILKNIDENDSHIQCVVSSHHLPFGQTQFPKFYEFADGVDTLSFLERI